MLIFKVFIGLKNKFEDKYFVVNKTRMSISTSTCHICLEELDFDLNLKKKCCPTQAFICNGCWEKIMNTEEIVLLSLV